MFNVVTGDARSNFTEEQLAAMRGEAKPPSPRNAWRSAVAAQGNLEVQTLAGHPLRIFIVLTLPVVEKGSPRHTLPDPQGLLGGFSLNQLPVRGTAHRTCALLSPAGN
jgi:hypothetical protein